MSCLLWEDEFYEDGQAIAKRILETVKLVPFDEVCKIAVEARTDMKLRHVPLLLVTALTEHPNRNEKQYEGLLRHTVTAVIQRADEMAELLSIYWRKEFGGRRPVANAITRGIADVFPSFIERALFRYDKRDAAIRMRDVMFKTHPKPLSPSQKVTFEKIIAGESKTFGTWEDKLSEGEGAKTDDEKRARWEVMLAEHSLGGLALTCNSTSSRSSSKMPSGKALRPGSSTRSCPTASSRRQGTLRNSSLN
jgi:hypothetical protein